MKIILPKNVKRIIDTLYDNGFEAYAVGGCVRDTLLGRNPQDWDITTSAKPEQVKALFKHTIDTGIEHGTVTIMLDHVGYEVTTYRIDGEYEDARHPKEVTFTSNLVEDLKRRDFTINAMAYNDQTGLVDAFDGIADLENKVIRCVGTATDRFSEDALRMLRAVRFAAQLGFEIEEETCKAISQLSHTIEKVSAERIQVELVKLLVSDHPDLIRKAYELGLTKVFLPEFDVMMEKTQASKHHMYTVGEHTIQTLLNIKADKVLRLTMLLHDVGKPKSSTIDEDGKEHFKGHEPLGAQMAKEVLKRLKFDNKTIDSCEALIRHHDDRPSITQKSVRRAMNRIGLEQFPQIFDVKRADVLGQSMYQREEKLKYVDDFEQMYNLILQNSQCVTKKDLKISGRDLIALGMKPGKEIGDILDKIFEMVLDDPELNTEDKLKELAHKMVTPLI